MKFFMGLAIFLDQLSTEYIFLEQSYLVPGKAEETVRRLVNHRMC